MKQNLYRRNKVRKINTIRKFIVLSMISVVCILSLSFGCFSFFSKAQNQEEEILYKYYTNIEVQYGETIWDIASEYCTGKYADEEQFVKDVMQINSINNVDYITPGSYLIIPYYSTEFKL